MKKLKRQIIASVGLNSCGVKFTPEVFKECVENIKNESLPILDCFDRNHIIGFMTNFEFKDGKILADINSFDDIPFDKLIRCSFEIMEHNKLNETREIKKCKIIEGGLIDKTNDTDKELL